MVNRIEILSVRKSSLPVTILMIGNPGVGKSTLLDGLLGQVKFKSGISLGNGLTTLLQEESDALGNRFIDTPGLSDEEKRRDAANEIEKALKKGGSYRIFFVVTLESGRIRSDDKTTVRLVLEAATEITSNSFAFIINKTSPQICEKVRNQQDFNTFRTKLNAELPAQTDQVFFNSYDHELCDRDNHMPSLGEDFIKFISAASVISVTEEKVKNIQWDQFDKLKKELAQKSEEIERNKRCLEELKGEQEAKFSALHEQRQQEKIEFDKKLKHVEEERARDRVEFVRAEEARAQMELEADRNLKSLQTQYMEIKGLREEDVKIIDQLQSEKELVIKEKEVLMLSKGV